MLSAIPEDSEATTVEERSPMHSSTQEVTTTEPLWSFDEEMQEYIVSCPHCAQPHLVPVKQLHCCQFACGADSLTGKQLPSHISPMQVAKLRNAGRIIGGCGERFKFNPRKGELAKL